MSKSIFHGHGFYVATNTEGKKVEDDFLTCRHCQQGMLKSAWKLKGGMCMVCEGTICSNCHERTRKFGCEGPYVKELERAVNEDYKRRQNAKILGI